jgi:hypothetical protein
VQRRRGTGGLTQGTASTGSRQEEVEGVAGGGCGAAGRGSTLPGTRAAGAASKYLGTLSSYVREPALEINSGRVDRTGGARGNWTGRARVELFWGATNVRS